MTIFCTDEQTRHTATQDQHSLMPGKMTIHRNRQHRATVVQEKEGTSAQAANTRRQTNISHTKVYTNSSSSLLHQDTNTTHRPTISSTPRLLPNLVSPPTYKQTNTTDFRYLSQNTDKWLHFFSSWQNKDNGSLLSSRQNKDNGSLLSSRQNKNNTDCVLSMKSVQLLYIHVRSMKGHAC